MNQGKQMPWGIKMELIPKILRVLRRLFLGYSRYWELMDEYMDMVYVRVSIEVDVKAMLPSSIEQVSKLDI